MTKVLHKKSVIAATHSVGVGVYVGTCTNLFKERPMYSNGIVESRCNVIF